MCVVVCSSPPDISLSSSIFVVRSSPPFFFVPVSVIMPSLLLRLSPYTTARYSHFSASLPRTAAYTKPGTWWLVVHAANQRGRQRGTKQRKKRKGFSPLPFLFLLPRQQRTKESKLNDLPLLSTPSSSSSFSFVHDPSPQRVKGVPRGFSFFLSSKCFGKKREQGPLPAAQCLGTDPRKRDP